MRAVEMRDIEVARTKAEVELEILDFAAEQGKIMEKMMKMSEYSEILEMVQETNKKIESRKRLLERVVNGRKRG